MHSMNDKHKTRASREKGVRTERAVVHLLQAHGIDARRTAPLQTYAPNDEGDVEADIAGHKRRLEVKCRASGFKQIYEWLDGNDVLILKADRKPMLVVLTAEDALEMIRAMEKP